MQDKIIIAALDLETDGKKKEDGSLDISGQTILEIGRVVFEAGHWWRTLSSYSSLLIESPESIWEGNNIEQWMLNGYGYKQLFGSEFVRRLVKEFEHKTDAYLIHNGINFDTVVLRKYGISPSKPVIDFYHDLPPDLFWIQGTGYSLSSLCQRFNVVNPDRHAALGDCLALKLLMKRLVFLNLTSVEQLIASASTPLIEIRLTNEVVEWGKIQKFLDSRTGKPITTWRKYWLDNFNFPFSYEIIEQ